MRFFLFSIVMGFFAASGFAEVQEVRAKSSAFLGEGCTGSWDKLTQLKEQDRATELAEKRCQRRGGQFGDLIGGWQVNYECKHVSPYMDALASLTVSAKFQCVLGETQPKKLRCGVNASPEHSSLVDVPVVVMAGSVLLPTKPVHFDGHTVWAMHQTGDRFEDQTYVMMHLDGVVSTTYNVSESLYTMSKDDVHFQCWFE